MKKYLSGNAMEKIINTVNIYKVIKILKFPGFTLAEVLITLGIVGVVAAITLPALVKYNEKRIIENQFKSAVATLTEGFRRIMAAEGVEDLSHTSVFEKCEANQYTTDDEWKNECVPMMKKYFANFLVQSVPDMQALGDSTNIMTDTAKCNELVGKTNKWWYIDDPKTCRGWKNLAFTFGNGIRVDMILNNSLLSVGMAGQITALDVNGSKGPNTWGRDTFYMMILRDGTVTGFWTKAFTRNYVKTKNLSEDWETVWESNNYKTRNYCLDPKNDPNHGIYCGSRIIDENWKINY